MAALLNEQGALRQEHVPLLEALVDTHLKVHGGDAERSIAALDINRSTCEVWPPPRRAVEASIAQIRTSTIEDSDGDADRTTNYAAGSSAADGARFRILRPHASRRPRRRFRRLRRRAQPRGRPQADPRPNTPMTREPPSLFDRGRDHRRARASRDRPGLRPGYLRSGRPYYAMRFIKGDSLKEAIERFHADATLKKDAGRRSLELRRLLRRFTDVCNTIEYAHSRRVLHRDIKPANVIVGKHGETLVVDWGLAKSAGKAEPARRLATSGPSCPAPRAEAPRPCPARPGHACLHEPRAGRRRPGPARSASDVYSLGATLYCLLTGKPPFEGDVGEVLRRVGMGSSVRRGSSTRASTRRSRRSA